MKHVVDHLIPVSRMADTYPQAIEIPAAEMSDQIAQSVVTTVSTAALQPDGTGGQVEIVMNNQYLLQWNPEEARQRTDCLTAAIPVALAAPVIMARSNANVDQLDLETSPLTTCPNS